MNLILPVLFHPIRRPVPANGPALKVVSPFEPNGDQPTAIAELIKGVNGGERDQVLLGVTGSGKTYTMAKVIESVQRPDAGAGAEQDAGGAALRRDEVVLPGQRGRILRVLYDYYQPEAYVPRTDTYIEKDSQINEQIDRMRHSATQSLLERRDVVIVRACPASTASARSRPIPTWW
jgi:excinuclease ABC subunit B